MKENEQASQLAFPVSRRRWDLVIAIPVFIFLAYGAFAWHAPEPRPPLKVAVGVWPGSESFVLGREMGYLDGNRVRLVEMAWSTATLRTFSNSVVDAAVLSLDQVLRLRESGHDIRAVLVMDFSIGADALLAHDGITSVAGLRGKRVGAELQSAGVYLLAKALATENMSISDVVIVPLNQVEMETAFAEGELDAVVAAEPWSSRLRIAGATSIYDSTKTPEELCRVLVVRRDILKSRREDLIHLVKAHFSAIGELQSGAASPGLGAVCRRHGLSLEGFRQELSKLKIPSLEENFDLLGGPTPRLETLALKVTSEMLERRLITRRPIVDKWMSAELLGGKP